MIGDVVGTLSVDGKSGVTYSLVINPNGSFSIAGNHLVQAADLMPGNYQITIKAVAPGCVINQSLSIRQTSPTVGIVPLLALDGVPIGKTVAEFSVTGGTGFSFSFSSNPGNLFALSGNRLIVDGLLSVGNITLGIQATNGSVTLSQDIALKVISVAKSWIPGLRPWAASSLCNTPLPGGKTYTPVAWPASTGFNYFTGVKYFIDIPAISETTVCSWQSTGDFGGAPIQLIHRVMTPGFNGVELLLNNGDGDNQAVSMAGTNCLHMNQFTRISDILGSSATFGGSGPSGDILNGTGFAIPGGGQFGNNLAAGALASGASPLMGILLKEEFTRYGEFNHWISFSMINSLTQPGFIAPAIFGDGSNPSGLFKTGQLLAIPRTTAMPGGLSTYGQALFRAMQNYGAWPFDTSGSVTPYMACVYDKTQSGASIPYAASTSWNATDKGLLVADVNILFPLLQAVS